MGWHREPLLGSDPETTGTDPRGARLVTGAVIEVRAGEPMGRGGRPAGPGVEIPADAVAVHAVSNARAAAEGRPADQVADAVAAILVPCRRTGAPAVARRTARHPRTPAVSQASRAAARRGRAAEAGAGAVR